MPMVYMAASPPFSCARFPHTVAARDSMSGRLLPGLKSRMDRFQCLAIEKELLQSVSSRLQPAGQATPIRNRVGYQGLPGAYSESAALIAYPDGKPVPYDSFESAFLAVEQNGLDVYILEMDGLGQWLVEKAVLPLENSLGGSIHRNYDLLLRHSLRIIAEVNLPIRHCLLALPGTKIEDLERVMSHPQALAQTEGYFMKLASEKCPGLVKEAVSDTAGAAAYIRNNNLKGCAAVASRQAAENYELDILADSIQDDPSNVTRFMVLARDTAPIPEDPDVPYKTSVVFTLERGAGMLFKALSVFALRDIDLSKIESRPLRVQPFALGSASQSSLNYTLQKNGGDLQPNDEDLASDITSSFANFDYIFYVDFLASMSSVRAQNALRHLQEFAPYMRVLGSYPVSATAPAPNTA